jgi:hypothetical protein
MAQPDISFDKNAKQPMLPIGRMFPTDKDVPVINTGGGTQIQQIQQIQQSQPEQVQPDHFDQDDYKQTRRDMHQLISTINDTREEQEQEKSQEVEEVAVDDKIECMSSKMKFNFKSYLKTAGLLAVIYYIFSIPPIQTFVKTYLLGLFINPNNQILIIFLFGIIFALVASFVLQIN